GLVGLTRSAASTYAKENIRCVLISPGHVDTPFIRENNSYSPNDPSTSIDNPDNYERRRRATPLGRLQTPEDIARAFLFAAADEPAVAGVGLALDQAGAREVGHDHAHRRRADLLGGGQRAERAGAAEDEDREDRELRRGQAAGVVIGADAPQEVDSGRVQAV